MAPAPEGAASLQEIKAMGGRSWPFHLVQQQDILTRWRKDAEENQFIRPDLRPIGFTSMPLRFSLRLRASASNNFINF